MKAAQIDDHGDETNITVRNIAVPEPGAQQIQVKVAAVGLNPFDNLVLAGYARAMAELHFPATLGIDFAGTITALGTDVTGFEIGQRVYGTANAMSTASGALAEYAIVSPEAITRTPDAISDQEAAALPTASLTALKTITQFQLQPGQRIFINGGAGGVGSSAIQLAKAAGAYVITSASSANHGYVASLGADEIYNYTTPNYLDQVRDCDFAFETVRRDGIDEILAVVKDGGIALSIVGPFDQALAAKRQITATENPENLPGALQKLSEAVAAGKLSVNIGRSFTLDDIKAAYHALNHESVAGKIVITVA